MVHYPRLLLCDDYYNLSLIAASTSVSFLIKGFNLSLVDLRLCSRIAPPQLEYVPFLSHSDRADSNVVGCPKS